MRWGPAIILFILSGTARADLDMTGATPVNLASTYRTHVHRALGFVRGITQTQDGYLWFGTSFGLAKYDGDAFVFFDRSNTPAFDSDHLVALIKSDDGSLWMAHERGGIVHLADWRFTAYRLPIEHQGLPLCCLAQDRRGVIWLGSQTDGIFSLQDGQWRQHTHADGLPSHAVTGLWRTHEGDVLVDTIGGWTRIRNGTIAAEDPKQQGYTSINRFILDNVVPESVRTNLGGFPASLADAPPITDIHLGRDGSLWIGGGGLMHVTPDGYKQYGYREGLASTNVYAVHEDHEGNVWIGHYGTGVTQMTRLPFATLTTAHDLGGGAVFSVAQMADGAVWLSGAGFMAHIRDGHLKNVRPDENWPFYAPRSLAAGYDNRIWLTTPGAHIFSFDGQRAVRYDFPPPRADDEFATAILMDTNRVLWLGSSHGGLLRLDPDMAAPTRVDTPTMGPWGCGRPVTTDFPCAHAINVLAARKAGGLWMGTHGTGLWHRDVDQTITPIPGPAGFNESTVFALYEDARDLWVGTDRGLYRVTGPDHRVAHLGRHEGLVSNGIFQILEDGRGHLWFGSERGIFHVAKTDLDKAIAGKQKRIDPVSYRAIDGIPSDEVVRRFEPHGLRDRDGRLWFTTAAGAVIFSAPETQTATAAPRDPLLERAVLKGHPVHLPMPNAPVTIAPGQGDLEFHYTVPSFAAPHRLRFRYRLDGFDNEWVDAGSRRSAFYTNIPPGYYQFRLQAHSPEGGSSRPITALTFQLRPQFHETTAFYLLLGGAAIMVAVAIQRFRIRQLQARYNAVETERIRIARDLHDTLAQVFSAMGFQIDSAMGLTGGAPSVLKDRLRRARQMVGHARLAARNVILNLRPRREDGTEGRSLQAMLEAIPPIYDAATVAVTVSGDQKSLPAVVENDLFHIAQEAVSNAIEHGRAQVVSVDLEYSDNQVELWIRDNGVGFETADQPESGDPGFGLRGMRERASRAGATLTVHAEAGVGTEVGVARRLDP